MNKWIRNLGVGIMSIAIVLAIFLGVENANSHAVKADDYTNEMDQASESFKKMDESSQQQFLSTVAGVDGVSSQMDLNNLDLETALMMVQQTRMELLDSQLKTQIQAVQKRNEQVQSLKGELVATEAELEELKSAEEPLNEEQLNRIQELEDEIKRLETDINNVSGSQQMDMLRLQSLSNKRNEAFDVMQNFIKKMQDSRSSIISNMR